MIHFNIINLMKRYHGLWRYYKSNLNQVYYFISDPDLTINVDLGREEEEKNGRRKYKAYSKKNF